MNVLKYDYTSVESLAVEFFKQSPGSCIEIHAWSAYIKYEQNYIVRSDKENSVVAGWFTRPDTLSASVSKFKGVSVYMSVNPLDPKARPVRFDNKLGYLRKNEGYKKEDFLCINWVIIDIDPISSASQNGRRYINGTDSEMNLCVEKSKQIINSCEHFRRNAFIGVSGNGAFILFRVNVKNSSDSYVLLDNFVSDVASEFSDNNIKIDKYNPTAMLPVPGSIKCKCQQSTPDRPWRLATISDPD